MSRIQELNATLTATAKAIQEEATNLTSQLSTTDRELSDIYHYIEFNDLSASAGFKAYKDLQRCLKNRRGIKNDLALADFLKASIPSVTTLETKEETLNVKYYNPRVREDLFPTIESRTVTSSNLIIAKGINARHDQPEQSFTSLEGAVDMLLSTKGLNFKPNVAKIKRKILQAANKNISYDNWVWSKR